MSFVVRAFSCTSEFSSCRCVFTDAPVVNPYDPMGVAREIQNAMTMTPARRLEACIENNEVCGYE